MGLYYNGKKVRNLYLGTKCITRLALGKEMTRLVEGDDFVRAKWLCGRNGAYIDTMHQLVTIDDALTVHARYDGTFRNPLEQEQSICGVVEGKSNLQKIWAYMYIGGSNQGYAVQKGVYKVLSQNDNFPAPPDSTNDTEFILTMSSDGNTTLVTKNSSTVTYSSNSIERKTLGNVYLFTRNTMNIPSEASQRYFQGDIAYFRITDHTFTIDRVNMVPCRLLRPIPASLDANGIARNAGECGMYDAVSGKFYGNVDTAGKFTVSDN